MRTLGLLFVACLLALPFPQLSEARTKLGVLRRATSEGSFQVAELFSKDLTPSEAAMQPLHVFRAPDGSLVEEPEATPVDVIPSEGSDESVLGIAEQGVDSSDKAVDSVSSQGGGVGDVSDDFDRVVAEEMNRAAVRIRGAQTY
eukprot:TRINITY_DN1297_c0_g1_i1.p2 TRINITY_DN1297_c0_g1~~TRINITY_DN1297_c0_g1_i1.p2  ORF type:complete len:144 (-),score=0.56 TRINITY_DN1297_c0_g1_i1:362-793(-)